MKEHPGGSSILMTVGGSDASVYFHELHNPSILKDYGDKFIIGMVEQSKL